MQRSDLPRFLPELVAAIERGLALPSAELPEVMDCSSYPHYTVMAQFLYAALCSKCSQERIAPQLVGGPGDVRELIAAECGTLPDEIRPKLLEGWRAELLGSFLSDFLHGRKSVRLNCLTSENPLVFKDV